MHIELRDAHFAAILLHTGIKNIVSVILCNSFMFSAIFLLYFLINAFLTWRADQGAGIYETLKRPLNAQPL